MIRTKHPPLNSARITVLICIGLLSLLGFLNSWLLCGQHFANALAAAVLPAVPGAMLYALEYQNRLLERSFQTLKDIPQLTIALPVFLACLGFLRQEAFAGSFWILGFGICVQLIHTTLAYRPWSACAALLLALAVCCGMSWHLDLGVGGALGTGILAVPLSLSLAEQHWETPDVPGARKASLLLPAVCLLLLLSLLGPFLNKLFFGAVTPETDALFSACMPLLPSDTLSSVPEMTQESLEVLRRRFPLGFLAAIWGRSGVIPVVLVMAVLLAGSGILVRSKRPLAPLALGCWYLLLLRAADDLLTFVLADLGLTGGFPFFSGSSADRTLDFLLAALVLMPLKPEKLEHLNPEDPDFVIREAAALSVLPENLDGLAQLCRYVYNNATNQGWKLLLTRYLPLLDANSLRIMVLNADTLFSTDGFREHYPVFFRMAGTQMPPLPEVLQTAFPDNSYITRWYTYESSENTLKHFWGEQDALLIPPFWRTIGPEALASHPQLKAVSIPHTVRRIAFGAFLGCSRLEYVELRRGLEEIGSYAFSETGLKQIRLPDTLKAIEDSAFSETRLTDIRIPGSVSRISELAFEHNLHLRSVVLEEGVTEICANTFRECPRLEELYLPDTVTKIHPSAFAGCANLHKVEVSDAWKERYPDLYAICTDPSCHEKRIKEVLS